MGAARKEEQRGEEQEDRPALTARYVLRTPDEAPG